LEDGYLYSFPVYKSKDGAVSGVTVMRTSRIEDPKSWRFWTGEGGGDEGFTGVWHDPYGGSSGGRQPAILRFGTPEEEEEANAGDDGRGASPSQPVPRYIPHLDLFIMSGT